MHTKNFCSEFLNISKNDFRPAGAYAPMSQSGFPLLFVLVKSHNLVFLGVAILAKLKSDK
jgi:hypothetical protein